MSVSIKRGEIYYADLSPVVGSEQGGIRPVLIVQNNVAIRQDLYYNIKVCVRTNEKKVLKNGRDRIS